MQKPKKKAPTVKHIAAALKALPCSDDPSADRFKGHSKEAANLILVQERMIRLSGFVERWQTADAARHQKDGEIFTDRYQALAHLLHSKPGFGDLFIAILLATALGIMTGVGAFIFFSNPSLWSLFHV